MYESATDYKSSSISLDQLDLRAYKCAILENWWLKLSKLRVKWEQIEMSGWSKKGVIKLLLDISEEREEREWVTSTLAIGEEEEEIMNGENKE